MISSETLNFHGQASSARFNWIMSLNSLKGTKTVVVFVSGVDTLQLKLKELSLQYRTAWKKNAKAEETQVEELSSRLQRQVPRL